MKEKGECERKNNILNLKKSNSKMFGISKSQLEKGIKIEMEHTNNRSTAKKIAIAHFIENPNYYKNVKLSKGYIEKLVSIKKKIKKKK